jgi:glycosyltransferase involved in cell wall biosynthesis
VTPGPQRPRRATLQDLPAPPAGRSGWPWTEECAPLPAARPDGSPWPRVSIVTPVYNQGHYLEETLRSVLLQGYPDLEHVVVNDGSSDDSEEVVKRYAPWLSYWVTQPNQGQRAAINRGFEHVTGQVLAYLNSDDLLLPGALERAALEIDPARGRHVIMGRCRFTDSDGRYVGIEHPARFSSHARVLEVWKGHAIPQPSVFWTPEVWRACGPILEDLWVDYGLFCRFSKRYRFHLVDQVLSTYRLHPESKTQTSGEARRLREVVAISRRYWGAAWSPRRWRLELSYLMFRLDRRGRGLRALRAAAEHARHARPLRAALSAAGATLTAPEVVFTAALFPMLNRRVPGGLRRAFLRLASSGPSAETEAYLERDEPWPDGWCGPRIARVIEVPAGARQLRLAGAVELHYLPGPLTLAVSVDGHEVGRPRLEHGGPWELRLALPQPLAPGSARVEIVADAFFVPHRYLSNSDQRPLSWWLQALEAES